MVIIIIIIIIIIITTTPYIYRPGWLKYGTVDLRILRHCFGLH